MSTGRGGFWYIEILAIDVDKIAPQQLAEQAEEIPIIGDSATIRTLDADLVDTEIMREIPFDRDIIIVSLHACGAVSCDEFGI